MVGKAAPSPATEGVGSQQQKGLGAVMAPLPLLHQGTVQGNLGSVKVILI